MKQMVKNVRDKLLEVLGSWENIDTVTLMENDLDRYNPYFFLSFDVYYSGCLPSAAEREAAFAFAGGFESITRKDRFFADDIPVRLEYKDKARFNELIDDAMKNVTSIRDSGTYMFYRILNADVVYAQSEWIEESRRKLQSFTQDFWAELRRIAQAKMEHYLTDLRGAAVLNDTLFFQLSAQGLITSMCETLCAINRQFQPPPRQIFEFLKSLESTPDAFQGYFENFIDLKDSSLARKREIAELLVKNIIHL